jgi:hypothetical protein
MKETLEVGDIIKVSTWMNSHLITIERVTKTKAIGRSDNNSSATYDFRRDCKYGVKPFKQEKWSQTKYELI